MDSQDQVRAKIPRTSKWRLGKRLKLQTLSQKAMVNPTGTAHEISSPYPMKMEQSAFSDIGLAECEDDLLVHENVEESENLDQQERENTPSSEIQPGVVMSSNEDSWYNAQEDLSADTWYTNEQSIWYDAQEDLADGEDRNDSQNPLRGDAPIYSGASLSISESAVLILTFVLRHNLNGECLSDLLTLISLHCLSSNILHQSIFKFNSFFSELKSPLVIHTYCKTCELLLEPSESCCPGCGKNTDEKGSTSYFVEIPLLYQLQQLFNRAGFHKSLLHRLNRKCDNIGDIYDGELYKLYSKPGQFLHNKDNISFMWYTDGVPLFKSSKVSIWPLFFAINELPKEERFKQENLIFAGLWFGVGKPTMSCFMKPFHNGIKNLFDTGISLFCHDCKKTIQLKACLLCGTCDLPAKCMVLNMNQFNGKYGCVKCLQEGVVTKSGKGHTRTFPYILDNVVGPKRSHSQFNTHGLKAYQDGNPYYGVKGPSWWSNCMVDVINGTAIDYMHCVLLGIIRRLLSLWFDPKFNGEDFSVSSMTDVASKRLENIQPPHYLKRHPRDIKEQSKFWKASECRAWLFYYSIPVMFGILKDTVFSHYLLLCEAIYILNLDMISHSELTHAENLLFKFCGIYATVYGDEHMSANIHQLLHLPDCVRQLGPLWVYSCFSFESLNGKLVHLFHGTQNPVVQIANTVTTMLQMPILSKKLVSGSAADYFYKKMTCIGHHFKTIEMICENCFIVGSILKMNLHERYIQCASNCFHMIVSDYYVFQRIYFKRIMYHSKMYTTHKRNSRTVKYKVEGSDIACGIVLFYLKVKPMCFCQHHYCVCQAKYCAIIQKIEKNFENPFVSKTRDKIKATLLHVYTGILSNQIIAVPVTSIQGLGVFINYSQNKCCVIFPPNFVESD